jgi:hypothetical protein
MEAKRTGLFQNFERSKQSDYIYVYSEHDQFSHEATGSASGYLDKPLTKRVIYGTLK